jgi:hypothetical protein
VRSWVEGGLQLSPRNARGWDDQQRQQGNGPYVGPSAGPLSFARAGANWTFRPCTRWESGDSALRLQGALHAANRRRVRCLSGAGAVVEAGTGTWAEPLRPAPYPGFERSSLALGSHASSSGPPAMSPPCKAQSRSCLLLHH